MFSFDLRNISRCEAAYYTALLAAVNLFLKNLSVQSRLPFPFPASGLIETSCFSPCREGAL